MASRPRVSGRMRNALGQRGEFLFGKIMMDFFGHPRPYFRTTFFGEKAPAIDFLVELIDPGPISAYFLVQVKTTTLGHNRNHRLRVQVSPQAMDLLRSYPGPTYVVGIDDPAETGYILSARSGTTGGISSMPTMHPLTEQNLAFLYDEVRQYWAQQQALFTVSRFT